MHKETAFAKILIGFFALVMLGSGQAFADSTEKFYEGDLTAKYVIPDKKHPELSYVEVSVLYAHNQGGTDDMRSSGFRYEPDDSDYQGVFLYLNDGGKVQDKCFLWCAHQGKMSANFVFDKNLKTDVSEIEATGWKVGDIQNEFNVALKNTSHHECKQEHYCYATIRLYPPSGMNGRTITVKLRGGKGDRKWVWWREYAWNSNTTGTTDVDCEMSFPYDAGVLSLSDMKVDWKNRLLAGFSLDETNANAVNDMLGEFAYDNDTVRCKTGFLRNYLITDTLKNRVMKTNAIRRYNGQQNVLSARLYMPDSFNSKAQTKVTFNYSGFPYVDLQEAEFKMEKKTVNLRWNIIGTDILKESYVNGGHWFVKRKDLSTGETVTASLPLDLDKTEWTDDGIVYNNNSGYLYTVVYRQDEWGTAYDDKVVGKNATRRVKDTNTGCNLGVTAQGEADRVNVTARWMPSDEEDFYKVNLWRGSLKLTGDITIPAGVGTYTFTDAGKNGKLYSRVANRYKVQLIHGTEVFDEKEVMGNITGGTLISGLASSKGDYRDHVHLTWTSDRSAQDTGTDVYIIERRKLNSSTDDEFMQIGTVSSTTSYMSYDDNGAAAGDYYEYQVSVSGDAGAKFNSIRSIGFVTSTGSISGTVALKDGTAQQGITVSLEPMDATSTDMPKVLLHSLRFDGKNNKDGQMLTIAHDSTEYRKWLAGDFTVQFWYRPDKNQTGTEYLLTLPGSKASLRVRKESDDHILQLCRSGEKWNEEITVEHPIAVPKLSDSEYPWVHVTLDKRNITQPGTTFGSRDVKYYLKIAYRDAGQQQKEDSCAMPVTESDYRYRLEGFGDTSSQSVILGCHPADSSVGDVANFNGEIDELRMYARVITDKEREDTRYCRLSGSEEKLTCYLPMDEGIQGYTFDRAVSGGRQHSASMSVAVSPSQARPDGFSAYSTRTDNQGFYAITGIELANASFRVKPTRSILSERFGPAERYCTLSQDVLSLSDQDFTDSTTVNVSGRVCYRWGTYPVEGARVMIDGSAVKRNGSNVLTDQNGEFRIEMPVGRHYIEVKKNGHGFLDGGRFPDHGTYDFQRDTAYVGFTDSTLVLLRGRVSGGAQQAALPMAVGSGGGSKALIGQATLYIAPASNLNYRLNMSEVDTVRVDVDGNILVQADTAVCRSTEVLLPYRANPTIKGQVMVRTDQTTGEFRVLLPPMSYKVTYGSTKSVSNDEMNTAGLTEFNMTPGNTTVLNVRYDTEPVFEISDLNHVDSLGVNDGMFGEDSVMLDGVCYPAIDRTTGTPKYVMGYPLMKSGRQYTLLLKATQKFKNADYDEKNPWVSEVPLSNQLISFASSHWGNADVDTVRLNKEGKGMFQFSAATPNGNETPLYVLQGTTSLSGRTYSLPKNPMPALFTGFNLYDGQETLVEGPPSVDYVLRDPPGSKSYAVLQSGSTLTSSVNFASVNDKGTQSEWHTSFGAELNSKLLNVHATYEHQQSWSDIHTKSTGDGMTSTYTTTETYTTGTDAYHVGANGDLYLGHCTYIAYGKGYYYGLKQIEGTPAQGDYVLKSKDGRKTAVFCGRETMGCSSGARTTGYALAQRYITETLIPEWERVASSSTDKDSVQSAQNNANAWRSIIAYNEMQKLAAYKNKPDANLAYSAGAARTYNFSSSVKQSGSSTTTGASNLEWKVGANGTISFFVYFSAGGSSGKVDNNTNTYTSSESRQETVTHSYTLSDDNIKNNFDISVYQQSANPIFRVNAGASTNPWEGPDSTICYMPGKQHLSGATLKVEKCSFRIVNPNITDIPNGREATVLLELTNESEADYDQVFMLYADDATHDKGLIMTIDGAALTTAGIPVYITAGSTVTKTMKVRQSRQDIMDYDNLALNMAGKNIQTFEYKNAELCPRHTFSVHYTPSSSPVTFTVRDTTDKKITNVNMSSGTRIKLRAEDYQTDYQGFKRLSIQYKSEEETQWHTMGKVWTKAELEGTSRKDSLWDMKILADGTYMFRAETASEYGTGDIPFYSDTVTIVKDMEAPKLLGEPTPTDNRLGCEDQICYTFNENIYSGAVTKSNISLMMVKGSLPATGEDPTSGESVPFDFVVSDNCLVISPTMDKRLMEGNTLVVNIYDIEDMNGNKLESLPTKCIYVHQCPFVWIQASEYMLAFYNTSTGVKQWSLENVPSWLTLYDSSTLNPVEKSGTIGPNDYKTFYNIPKTDLPVGEYCDTMRVVNDEGLGESVVLQYTKRASSPYWTVSNKYAPYTATLTATLKKQEEVQTYDLIGAFINDTVCVGTAYPTYVDDKTGFKVMLSIYTDDSQKGKPLSFKLYDSLHDIIYTDMLLRNEKDSLVSLSAPQNNTTNWGTVDAPWSLGISDPVEHNYKLNWGWNWLSFNMNLDQSSRRPDIFLPDRAPVSDLEVVKSQTHSSKRDGNTFHGDLISEDFAPGNMLMIKTNNSYDVSIKGKKLPEGRYVITLAARRQNGPSYNWIGYTPIDAMSIDEAFAGLTLNEGDIVKSQTDFAYYTRGTWVGTLQQIDPLKGYVFSSNVDSVRHFSFPEHKAQNARAMQNAKCKEQGAQNSLPESPWIWDPTGWSMNMTAIATVRLDLDSISVGRIGIFDTEGNCRSVKTIADDGHVYLTISGDEQCPLKMSLQREDGTVYQQECPFSFTANASMGTYSEPVVLYFGKQPTGVGGIENGKLKNENSGIYNLAGQRINRPTQKGVFIENGEKVIR